MRFLMIFVVCWILPLFHHNVQPPVLNTDYRFGDRSSRILQGRVIEDFFVFHNQRADLWTTDADGENA